MSRHVTEVSISMHNRTLPPPPQRRVGLFRRLLIFIVQLMFWCFAAAIIMDLVRGLL